MILIEAIFVGKPRDITDEKGTWRSTIYRSKVEGQIELRETGLDGDRVSDTRNHGRPGQAVCVHPITHYDFWNETYGLQPPKCLGPGSVGENWTISGADEATVYCGDVYEVGSAVVRVSGPRMPCSKQERKLGLEGFLKRTIDSRRTGFYLQVLQPGTVNTADLWKLKARPDNPISLDLVNQAAYQELDASLLQRVTAGEGLAQGWKELLLATQKHQKRTGNVGIA